MLTRSFLPWVSLVLGAFGVEAAAINSTTATGKAITPSTTIAAPLASATAKANTTLSPLCKLTSVKDGYIPSKNISLGYGLNETLMMEVSLALNHSAVVLEDVPSVSKVDCDSTSKSVWITFNSSTDFASIQKTWSALDDSFILITNHMGDCDNEFERGFFLADVESLAFTTANMTAHVIAEKTDVKSTGHEMELNFQNIPVNARRDVNDKRGISFDESGLSIESDISLDPSLVIFKYDDYVTVTADHAGISSTVTYSGKLKYSIWQFKLTEFTFDVDKSVYHDIQLTFDFLASYNYTFEYDITPLSYFAVEIPGIISLGPELSFGIGSDFEVDGELSISTNFSSTVDNGNVHIDVLNPDESSVTNWEPKHTATTNITEKASLTITPFVSVTLELACEILGGALDLSTGVTVQPGFPVVFAATATENGVGTGNVTLPDDEDCPNGLSATVDFDVEITIFATQWASHTFDVYDAPIAAFCYDPAWF